MSTNKVFRLPLIVLALLICAVVLAPVQVMAAETVDLGTAEDFAVLAGSTVTNTGTTVISGSAGSEVGVSPGSAVTGLEPEMISGGAIHSNDAVAIQAQIDLTAAYLDAESRTTTAALTGTNLGGLILTPGVYSFSSSAQLTGTLTLDAEGVTDAAFIFQIGSTLTTAVDSSVVLINGAQYCRVFWQVGSSATLGTGTDFIGHIFALTSITANTGATVQGQLLARNGAVTLDTNTITNGVCAAVTTPPAIEPEPEPEPDEPDEPEPVVTPTPTAIVTPPAVVIPTPTSTPVAIVTTPAPVVVAAADADVPQTGDNSNTGLLISLMMLSVAGLVSLSRVRKKAR